MMFVMIAQADNFEALFPDKNYSYLVVIPNYVGIPLGIIFSKLTHRISLQAKLLIILAIITMGSIMIPSIALYLPNKTLEFWIILATFTVSHGIMVVYQAILVSLASIIHPKFVGIYYTSNASFNFILMIIKFGIIKSKANLFYDFLVTFGLIVLLSGLNLLLINLIWKQKPI